MKKRAPTLKKLHLDSFPAIHLNPMDWMDFILKFSGEILVLLVCLSVAAMNLFYFSFGNFNDKSPAAVFLSRHQSMNFRLANKNNSIVTTVSQGGFIPQAQAEVLTGIESLSGSSQDLNPDGNDIIMGDENYLLAPNPDSVKALVQKQVKVYQTQNGDSLKSLSQKFGISQQTIIWANSLTSNNIKPGWYLMIPPVDGIIVRADSNTTLPDIANSYNPQRYNPNKQIRQDSADQLLEKIISYNGLADEADVEDGQIIIVPGGAVIQPPAAPKPKPKPAPKRGGSSGLDIVTSISSGYDDENHIFPKNYCTWYVASRMKITFGGNAKNWLANARASGYVTGTDPAPHSAVVMAGPRGVMRRYGHVAYVEAVEGEQVFISEMNYSIHKGFDQRWVSIHDPSIKGYIYP